MKADLSELAEMCDTVAIIEQGRLLAVGSVEEIERSRQVRRGVHMRVLTGSDALANWLRARGDVHRLQRHRDGHHYEVDLQHPIARRAYTCVRRTETEPHDAHDVHAVREQGRAKLSTLVRDRPRER